MSQAMKLLKLPYFSTVLLYAQLLLVLYAKNPNVKGSVSIHDNLYTDFLALHFHASNNPHVWIIKHVEMIFGSLKIASGEDTMMGSAAKCYSATYNALNKWSSAHVIIRTKHCICTVIIC